MNVHPQAGLAGLFDLLLDAVCAVDASGQFVFISPACEAIFGYRPDEMIGRNMLDFIAPADRERTALAAQQIMAGDIYRHFENRYLHKDGHIVHIMWSARWSEADQLRIAVARDVTALKRAEATQAALYAISEAVHLADDLPQLFGHIYRTINTLLPAPNFAVVFRDDKRNRLEVAYEVDTHLVTASQTADSTLCAAVIESGQPLLLKPDMLSEQPVAWRDAFQKDWQCWLGVPLNSQKGTFGALILKRYTGDVAYSDGDRELLHYVSTQIATAIERKQLYNRLQHLSQYDELTGLPNRTLLQDRMATALARARREQTRLSVLFLDLDHFKQINDSLGHAAGDQLLQIVAAGIRDCMRATDTVARIGGDEFVVLMESVRESADAHRMCAKIRERLAQEVLINGHNLRALPSIGMAHYPEHGASAEQLLRHADDAMYANKKAARLS